ncbi:hypothetical protein VDG09_02250 [Xanthomonas campestris pv. raphani]|uniref:hypothetical protein n=1 Tax=Xanthomonas campestris TaxID=339 RepID=UPI002B236984|nr:hypothetical protein [Xanthomonas campestris]MEA9826489.1 hypothetical protein [Xanthomonas campestris pv. raphani]
MLTTDVALSMLPAITSSEFPEIPPGAIERIHVIETISQIATNDVPVVFAEGPEGCGATTLLAQFCIQELHHCFYLFIKPASRFSYSVEYLRRVLAEQYCAYVGRDLLSENAIDVAEYFSLQLAVRKKRGSRPIYFVVDGVQQIPASDEKRIADIFTEVLPLGTPGFRFIIAGDSDLLSKYIQGVKYKSYYVQKFSISEAKLFLDGVQIPDNQIDNIIKICKGLPGRLASVRKLIQSGVPSDDLLGADPTTAYPDFIAMEFKRSDDLNEVQCMMLATLAYSRYPLSRSRLKEICSATEYDLQQLLQSCGFLVHRKELDLCEFESETYRRYAATRLEHLRHMSISLQIDHLSQNPATPEAIQFLPAYHNSLNQQQSIIDMLVPEHYSQLLTTTNSITSLRARAALGSRSAIELRQVLQIFQFALQRSIFAELAFASGFKAQIGALIAINQPAKALDLALSYPTNEIQIQMLAEYAARKKEDSGVVDHQIIESIRELFNKVDFTGIGEDLEDLAENVAYFDADLAISILDKVGGGKNDSTDRDKALIKLTLANAGKGKPQPSISEKTGSQVSDERHRSIISFITGYFGGLNLSQVTAITERMDVNRRIYFLRSVLSGPDIGENSLDIVDYALGQMISSSSYLPRMTDLADFATPLTYVKIFPEKTKELIVKFDGQMGLVQESSGSVSRVSLRMKLAIGSSYFDFAEAKKRALEIYYEIEEIQSLEAKVECLAIMLKGLTQFYLIEKLDQEERISEVIRDDLSQSLVLLLENTASHFEVVRRSLGAIAVYSVEEAISVAKKLNTSTAKNRAYEYISGVIASLSFTDDRKFHLKQCIENISESRVRDRAIVAAVKSGVRGTDQGRWSSELLGIVRMIKNPAECSEALIYIIKSHIKNEKEISQEVFFRFESAAKAVVSTAERADILYQGASALGRSKPEQAEKYFLLAESARTDSLMYATSAERIICICLSLLLRASRILIKFDQFDDGYLARFSRLCSQISDPVTRVSYLSDLASKCVCEGKTDMAKKIVHDLCMPIIGDSADESFGRKQMFKVIFIPLFLTKGKSALPYISDLSESERDERLNSALETIIKKISESDHWTGEEENCCVSLNDAEDCISLIEEMNDDVYISSSVRSLVSSLLSRASKSKITSQQRISIRDRLIKIVRLKLPAANGVNHEGYLIEVEAYLNRLGDNGPWESLLDRARAMVNLADKVLVQMEIAKSMPSRIAQDAKQVLVMVKEDIARIPSPYDRFSRLESLIEAARQVDPVLARSAVKDAMSFSFHLDNEYAASRARRNILDCAEQVDPKMLDELIAEVDDDPARANAKAELQRLAKVQKVRRKIASVKPSSDLDDLDRDILPQAAWKNVGSLISGRSEPLVPELLSSYVAACGDWSLEDAYPVLSWYIENISRRLMRQEDVSNKVSPLWEILMLSTELAGQLIGKTSGDKYSGHSDNSLNGMLVRRETGHEDAGNFLRIWLANLDSRPAEIIFCDPYFSPSDIDLIRIVFAERPLDKISILTSKKAIIDLDEKSFEKAWNRAVDQDPPEVNVVGISDIGDDRSPVHDRWLLRGSKGLRLGTSFSGLGSRLSEISELDELRANELTIYLSRYVRKDREVEGRRVSYLSQTL